MQTNLLGAKSNVNSLFITDIFFILELTAKNQKVEKSVLNRNKNENKRNF
jgi:hypothetical protein